MAVDEHNALRGADSADLQTGITPVLDAPLISGTNDLSWPGNGSWLLGFSKIEEVWKNFLLSSQNSILTIKFRRHL